MDEINNNKERKMFMLVANNLETLQRIHPTHEQCKKQYGREWYKKFNEVDSIDISRASLIRNIDSYYRKYGTSEVVKLLAKGFLGYECIKDNPDLVADLKRALEKVRSE